MDYIYLQCPARTFSPKYDPRSTLHLYSWSNTYWVLGQLWKTQLERVNKGISATPRLWISQLHCEIMPTSSTTVQSIAYICLINCNLSLVPFLTPPPTFGENIRNALREKTAHFHNEHTSSGPSNSQCYLTGLQHFKHSHLVAWIADGWICHLV